VSDTIVVSAITQQLNVSPVVQSVSVASPGPQGSTTVYSVSAPLVLASSNISLDYSQLIVNGGTP
jgi:hypothetical protein